MNPVLPICTFATMAQHLVLRAERHISRPPIRTRLSMTLAGGVFLRMHLLKLLSREQISRLPFSPLRQL